MFAASKLGGSGGVVGVAWDDVREGPASLGDGGKGGFV